MVDARTGDVLQRENMVKFAAPAARGWLPAGAANLTGPNAHAYSDVNDDTTAQASEEVGRVGGSFAFPLVSVTGSGCDAGHLCSWSGGTSTDWQANRAQGTVQSLPTPLRIPNATGTATIEFKQPIAATDVLRTGAYANALTFTLTPTGP